MFALVIGADHTHRERGAFVRCASPYEPQETAAAAGSVCPIPAPPSRTPPDVFRRRGGVPWPHSRTFFFVREAHHNAHKEYTARGEGGGAGRGDGECKEAYSRKGGKGVGDRGGIEGGGREGTFVVRAITVRRWLTTFQEEQSTVHT